ncbi:putative elongator complex protein 1 [Drosophila obscura]|uniref:putative elongator complex protein 1 n=1 Tax=Drosophila obscura TaxID=7282 RepID=UPI001BB121CC|nr:putative elongator complex protein 1 [Drosophila obscura]
MRNLKLLYCNERETKVPKPRQMLQDPEISLETSYIATDSHVYAVTATGDAPPKVIADLPDIVAAEFLQLNNVICVATRAGEVLLIDPDTLATSEGTYCDVGIERMAWSPNQEVVAFITSSHNVVVMNSTFDVIAEQPLEAELPADQQFINVGWGKKETQFQGSAGKQAAKQSTDQPNAQDSQQLLNQEVNIAWRGDGACFVVSYVSGGRTFKVYDSEGKLQHTAEKSSNLREIIAWRPSGNWIAVPQCFPNKSTISLFEKNGLRHRELVLPFDLQEEPILQLKWSEDSDILAIRTAREQDQQQRVYLYTIGNYHWYLKQVLVYADTDPVAVLHWDTRMGAEQTLHVLLESGKQLVYCWAFDVEPYAPHGIVAVIDGKRLLLTDCARAVVPPPMSQRVLQLDNYINALAWDDQQLCVFTCDRRFHCYELKQRLQQQPEPRGSFDLLPADEQLFQLANLTYYASDGQLLATTSVQGNTRLLCFQKVELCYSMLNSLRMNGLVNALSRATHNCRHIYAHTLDSGKTYDVSLKADKTFSVAQAQAKQFETSLEGGLITLRRQQLLQLGGAAPHRIAEDVTSFLFFGTYLAYTQLNTLHFVDTANRQHLATRNIERGAKLVTAIDEEARLVLQLPRGNLEAIHPRLLVLDQVRVLLNDRRGSYLAAMKLLRKHRINLNIICDTNVEKFVAHVDDFLRDIQESQWLCLFINELQNEDTTAMYPRRANEAAQCLPPGFKFEQKVAYICGLLSDRMTETSSAKDRSRFRLPLVTVCVRLGDVNAALKLIRKDLESPAQEDQFLKYLMYLVDINELYNVALGSYDLGMALFVAQKSQKDPKEFLQYLNELRALPEDYRKFRIDDHLKRYSSAVQHLARCGEEHHEEAMEFIRKHGLYTVALASYKAHPEFHRRLCVAYADQLRANAKLENASLMYERGGELQQALLSARHTLDWERVLVLAKALGEQPLEQVALSLVGPLQQQGRHLEASELVKEHVQDKEKQLEVLLEGHLYGKAIYEAGLQGGDILDAKIAPALVAHAEQMHSSLKSDLQLFLDYKQRLLDIRQRRANGADAEADDGDVDIDEVDLLSDTTSMHSSRFSGTSRGTGKTFRSSKNRRKHERKLLSLKPGNPFEDIALIDALHQHVTKIGQQQQVVRDTCKALLQLGGGEDTLAQALQREFKTLLQTVESALDEIWIPELVGSSGTLAQHLTGPNVDYMALQKEQRYALISPLKRFKPQLNAVDWQHEILQ